MARLALSALLGCARKDLAFDPNPVAECPAVAPDSPGALVHGKRGFHAEHVLSGKLGEGAYGTVYLASHVRHGVEVAVKVMDLRKRPGAAQRARAAMMREVALLRLAAASPYVVRFVDLFVEGGLAYVLLERCEQSLLEHLEGMARLTERSVRPVLRSMMSGIAAVHGLGITHRDIKPDNFLFHKGHVKLCDFGLACQSSTPDRFELKGMVGTPAFMAPEMMSGEPYSAHVDVWSFGVVAYVLCFGSFPYEPALLTGPAMIAAIRSGSPSPSYQPKERGPQSVSHGAVRFLRALLCRRPGWRLTSSQALQHKFLDDRADEAVEGEEASLRPMLASAKRIGAFSPAGGCYGPSQIDARLLGLQERHRKVSAKGDADWSEGTRAGSSSCLSSVSS